MANLYDLTKEAKERLKKYMEEKTAETEQKEEAKVQETEKTSGSTKQKSAEEILSDLRDIERDYANNDYIDAPDSLGMSKVDVPSMTEDELKNLAKDSLEEKYNTKKESTNNSYDKKIEDLIKSQETAKQNAEDRKSAINSAYDESIKSTENQALKRGLARSSIVIGQLAGLESSRAEELSSNLKNLETKLNDSETQISALEQAQLEALSNLEIEYAMELETKISKLQEDYQKRVQEAIEFNNNVEKLEAEYKLKLDKQKTDKQKTLTELQNKYGTSYTKYVIQDAQYEYLRTYLDTLDKEYALALLSTNKDFKTMLGSRYTDLYSYLSSK